MKLPIMYFKSDPSEYCRITVGGKVVAEDKGISRLILPYKTNVEKIRTSLITQPYSFVEITSDNQQITIQGSYVYNANEPKKVLDNFNCSIDPRQNDSEDFTDISDQIKNNIRGVAKQYIQKTSLEDMLKQSATLEEEISKKITASSVLSNLGLNVQTIYVNQITPEAAIAKALGAVYREGLLTTENKATYDRRAEAVMQEKQIKENELNNSIALERQRKELVTLQEANARIEGAYKAQVLKMELDSYNEINPEILKAHALIQLSKNNQGLTTLAFGSNMLLSGESK
ncbi:MAG: SPFH domain-containing protein [Candidatus Woesearchaeota archaeon]